ncbi:MAG: RNA 3'-terminal phosphate cyclase, partial [Blastocatellia bacterium]
VKGTIHRYGFYPAGGGKLTFTISPATRLRPLQLTERGAIVNRRGRAIVASLPVTIAEREAAIIARKLSWTRAVVEVESVTNSAGPGNVVLIEIGSENVTEVFTGFGERGVAAEDVANAAVKLARKYLAAEVPVSEYLADQLMIPLAIAGGGSFVTLPLSRHSTTNMEVIHKFLDARITASEIENRKWLVTVTK